MRRALIILFVLSLGNFAQAQDRMELQRLEDEIKSAAYDIMNGETMQERFRADSAFTRGLVKALRTPHSFNYHFDSLTTISQMYPPDSSFRIFTWQMEMEDLNNYRQKGAIQMRTTDGSLKLIPLFDFSKFTEAPTDSVRDAQHWIGAVYYNIIQTTFSCG